MSTLSLSRSGRPARERKVFPGLTVLIAWCVASSATLLAQHSDIELSFEDGVLRSDRLLYWQNIRENALSDDIWASDNPGFAGSGFKFRDEFFFDIAGPLRSWTEGRWSSDQVSGERIRYFQPTPFGDPVNAVTVEAETESAEGFLIQRANTLGRIHQHYTFELSADDGEPPADGAYAFDMTVRSPGYGVSTRFTLVFNNGLSGDELLNALTHLLKVRIASTDESRFKLKWESIDGVVYQPQSRVFDQTTWSDVGEPFVGTGDVIEIDFPIEGATRMMLYRIRQTLSTDG